MGNPEADWSTNVIQSPDWLSLTGYKTLLVDVMEAEMGTYFFKSDVLEENGYNEYLDATEFIVQKAHTHDIKILARQQTQPYAML